MSSGEEWRKATASDMVKYYEGVLERFNDDAACEQCQHWEIAKAAASSVVDGGETYVICEAKGECRRFPPHPKYGHPTTGQGDHCGEFLEEERDRIVGLLKRYVQLSAIKSNDME